MTITEAISALSMLQGEVKIEVKIKVLKPAKEGLPIRKYKLVEGFDIVVKEALGLSIEDLKTKLASRENVEARWIWFDFLVQKNQDAKFSLNEVGRLFGRDHSTVISGIRQYNFQSKHDEKFMKKIKEVERVLNRVTN
jgi:chromosomal replication initiation ATPase DnaA